MRLKGWPLSLKNANQSFGDPMTSAAPVKNEPFGQDGVTDETLRRFAGYHLKRASNLVQADLKRTLEPFGLRMVTFSALVLIVDNPGLRQSQLAQAMDIERPNLVVIVDELEQRNLIVRDKVPTDRRAYALHVTPSGRVLQKQAVEAVEAHEAKLLASWDAETKEIVSKALKKIGKLGGGVAT